MHALRIVQELLRTRCPHIHAARLTVIQAAVAAAVHGRRLTLTELGRALIGLARIKHSIKRIDRLLGNPRLDTERFSIYRASARWVLGRQLCPIIVVDWSDLTADRRWQLLRAALPIGGRTLTLYEEVHPLRHFANPRVHRAFLARLQALLPEGITPILITDAGFRAPWFKAVSRWGWHWIGRIRNRDYLRARGSAVWIGCKTLYPKATACPQTLGPHEVVRSNAVACQLYLVKRPRQHRVKKSVFGQRVRSNQSLKQACAQREPWLLAASPSLAHLSAQRIVNLYATRMQIEEAFRDLKCERYGLGFSLNRSRTRQRIAALLLIALLAFLVLWLIGRDALAQGLQFHYQSNTRRSRPVLSLFNLACQLVRRSTNQLPPRDHYLHLPIRSPLLPNYAL